jgi:DNA-binding transcriptional LysR family regulator
MESLPSRCDDQDRYIRRCMPLLGGSNGVTFGDQPYVRSAEPIWHPQDTDIFQVQSVELRDLRLAIVASQHRSLRQAAETIRIRQSTLSRRLRDLELRVGVVLFERTSGGTRPTVAGLEFFELARRILEDTDAALRNLRSRSRGENGRLTIGTYASLAAGNMHATLADYHRRFPEVELHTMDGSHSRLISALGRDAVDVAIMANYRAGWDDRALSLWTERVIVALPEHHPLVEHDTVSWRQLVNERLILPLHGPGPELESLLAAKLNGDKPNRVLRQESGLDRLLSLVSVGYGVLLMLEGGTGIKQDGVVYREIQEDAEPTRLGFAAYWRQANGNPTLQPFLKMLQERYPDLSGAPAV